MFYSKLWENAILINKKIQTITTKMWNKCEWCSYAMMCLCRFRAYSTYSFSPISSFSSFIRSFIFFVFFISFSFFFCFDFLSAYYFLYTNLKSTPLRYIKCVFTTLTQTLRLVSCKINKKIVLNFLHDVCVVKYWFPHSMHGAGRRTVPHRR